MEDKVVPMISKRILAGSDWDFARRIFHPLLPVGLAPKEGYGRETALAALQKYASGLTLTL